MFRRPSAHSVPLSFSTPLSALRGLSAASFSFLFLWTDTKMHTPPRDSRLPQKLPGSSRELPEAPLAKALCLHCSTAEGPEAPPFERHCACTPQSSRKLPGSSRKLLEAPLAQALCLYCSTEEGPEAPPLERLCASNAAPGSAQGCPNAQCSQCSPKLVPVLLGKNHSAPNAHTK